MQETLINSIDDSISTIVDILFGDTEIGYFEYLLSKLPYRISTRLLKVCFDHRIKHIPLCLAMARKHTYRFSRLVAELFAKQILFNIYTVTHNCYPVHKIFNGMVLDFSIEKSIGSENGIDDKIWGCIEKIISAVNFFSEKHGILRSCSMKRKFDPIKCMNEFVRTHSSMIAESKMSILTNKIIIHPQMRRKFFRLWCTFARNAHSLCVIKMSKDKNKKKMYSEMRCIFLNEREDMVPIIIPIIANDIFLSDQLVVVSEQI